MKTFLSIFIFGLLSCNSQTRNKDQVSEDILSEVDYNQILNNKVVDGVPVEMLDIGKLNVTSGQIIACDPLVGINSVPFTKKVAPGKYPVKLYIAKMKDSGDRCALAKLEFSNKKAVRWVLALTNEDKPQLLKKGEYLGFPVDAGLGSFFDYNAFKAYEKFCSNFEKQNPEKNIYDDLLADEFLKNADKSNPSSIGDWLNYQIPGSEYNVVMFQSGYGDGLYPAYWGIDDNGKIASIIIDFMVLLNEE